MTQDGANRTLRMFKDPLARGWGVAYEVSRGGKGRGKDKEKVNVGSESLTQEVRGFFKCFSDARSTWFDSRGAGAEVDPFDARRDGGGDEGGEPAGGGVDVPKACCAKREVGSPFQSGSTG